MFSFIVIILGKGATPQQSAAAGVRCSSFTNHVCVQPRCGAARALEPFFFLFSEVMSLCIEAHNNFRATATSGCDICNFEPNYLSALVLGACPSVISSLCAFCYRRRFIGILFRLRSMRVYKCRRPLRPR